MRISNASTVVILVIMVLAILLLMPRLVPAPTPVSSAEHNITGNPIPGHMPLAHTADSISSQVMQTYGKLPLSFEINQGQTAPEVRFLSRGAGYELFLTSTEAVMMVGAPVQADRHRLEGPSAKWSAPASVLRVKLVGSNVAAMVQGVEELPGKSNYFIGNDPKKWRTNVQQYAKVQYHDVYPGIDLLYYGNQGQLEHDFVVAPGADPKSIRLSIEGAQKLSLDNEDSLVVRTDDGELQLKKPMVYQEIAGVRQGVRGRFVLDGNQAGFAVGPYDPSRALVIDPVLIYSTFLGGSDVDGCCGVIAVDAAGNAYFSGTTRSVDYPTTSGSFQSTFAGAPAICNQPSIGACGDTVVTKLNAAGTAIVYSTYLGGTGADANYGLALDSAGNVYVSGVTESTDFPITPGALQPHYNGGNCTGGYILCGDVFVSKINATGSQLVYSTYLGGNDNDYPQNLTVDTAGDAYVVGQTSSADFPTTPGVFQPNLAGPQNAFVSKLNATGTKLQYSSFLGGSGSDGAYDGIQVDAVGSAYVSGITGSTDFPVTTNAYQSHLAGDDDLFLAVVNPAGTKLLYSTYFGGSGKDVTYSNGALDTLGNIYIPGFTASADFPATPGAYQTTFGGGICNAWYGVNCSDAFVVKLNPLKGGAASLVYSTYLGTDREDQGFGIAVDMQGNAYITGVTSSKDFPMVNSIQAINRGRTTGFIAKLNPAGSSLLFSTFLGGSNSDAGNIAVDQSGNMFVGGGATSTDFPTTPRALQPAFAGGSSDLYVAKIGANNAPGVSFFPTSLAFGRQSVGSVSPPQTVVLSNMGSAPLSLASIQTTGNFTQTNNCEGTLAGAGTCGISITFSPSGVGSRTGTLALSDNAIGSPQKLILTGTGK
jgi:Beta-propeller repeat